MNYVSKSQVSTIQDIIYPRPAIPMTFPHHKQNLKLIKEYEQRNRQIQEEKEAYVPRNIFIYITSSCSLQAEAVR